MTDEELAAAEKACSVIAPGPWVAVPVDGRENLGEIDAPDACCLVLGVDSPPTIEAARFIANARQLVPALVAEVRRLRAEIKRVAGLFVAEHGPIGEQKITLVGDSYHVEMPAPIRIRALHQEEACVMAARAEREACAKLAEEQSEEATSYGWLEGRRIAAAIRARGET